MYFCGAHYRQPIEFDDERLAEAGAQCARIREAARRLVDGPSPEWSAPLREQFFDALANDFNTPRALAAVFDWVREANRGEPATVGNEDLREMLDVFGLANLLEPEAEATPGEVLELAQERETARARARFRARRRPARRARGARLGGPRRPRRAGAAPASDELARVIVYGRNPVREAIRGPRTVRRVWASNNARREPWLAAVCVGSPRWPAPTSSSSSAARRTSGRVRRGGAVPLRRRGRAPGAPEPLIVALDQVQDPQNLGAIARSRPSARGSSGLVLPERRSAEVTPAVCKASAGAVEHLPIAKMRNLADFLADAKRAGLWCYGADQDGAADYADGRLRRAACAGARLGGARAAPARRRAPATCWSRSRSGAGSSR